MVVLSKIWNLGFRNTKQQKEKRKKRKKRKEKKKMSSTQFAQQVYDFQMEVWTQMLQVFEGKVVGSEDFNLETLKKEFFAGYEPGDTVKKVKNVPKKVKKPRAQTGYTYFGQQNKDTFNEEMEKMDEKPKYVTFVGQKWKELSEEAKNEWKVKATTAFEESQKE